LLTCATASGWTIFRRLDKAQAGAKTAGMTSTSTLWPFRKMHGLGNDFIIFDARERPLALTDEQIRRLCHRQTGIGCDQLIIMEPSNRADLFMRIYNADGSQVAACGNASRCVAELAGRAHTSIETKAGLLEAHIDGKTPTVDMGEPSFDWRQIPLSLAMDTLHMPVGWDLLSDPSAVNVGNPHVIFFVPDVKKVDLERQGPMIERDHLFPERVNVNIAQVIDRHEIRLRVWERGAGLTLACGTGACATTVAAVRRKLTERRVMVHLPGGVLSIEYTESGRMLMGGPVATAFTGAVDLSHFG
jgi:diaminopimelate epimerase